MAVWLLSNGALAIFVQFANGIDMAASQAGKCFGQEASNGVNFNFTSTKICVTNAVQLQDTDLRNKQQVRVGLPSTR